MHQNVEDNGNKRNLHNQAASKPISNAAVYHTLEAPKQPNDSDDNYPDTTNIRKPQASPELEYSYAKDTSIPKLNITKKIEDASNAVYHTLEEGQPPTNDLYKEPGTSIPAELEYTYAKNTETPRIAVAPEDAVYHTLEQEQPASSEQGPETASYIPSTNNDLYHTLEEPNFAQTETQPM